MALSATGKHADPSRASGVVTVPEPTFAEQSRTLLHLGRTGSLSTLSRRYAGFPYGSLMPYALKDDGSPVFLISTMAMHTQNLQANPHCSLLVSQPNVKGDPLAAARVTLIGNATPVQEEDEQQTRQLYLTRHANSKSWVDFEDFSFYRMAVLDIYYIAGFGSMGWFSAEEYRAASPDPLSDSADAILEHMNADHVDALIMIAREFAGIDSTEAAMIGVDKLGFRVRLTTSQGVRSVRIPFLREVTSPIEAREVLVEMTAQARQNNSAKP